MFNNPGFSSADTEHKAHMPFTYKNLIAHEARHYGLMPIIPTVGRLRQEDHKSAVSMDPRMRTCLNT